MIFFGKGKRVVKAEEQAALFIEMMLATCVMFNWRNQDRERAVVSLFMYGVIDSVAISHGISPKETWGIAERIFTKHLEGGASVEQYFGILENMIREEPVCAQTLQMGGQAVMDYRKGDQQAIFRLGSLLMAIEEHKRKESEGGAQEDLL